MVKILIAEDERDIRELISLTLEFAGYEIVSVQNGAEAVEQAVATRPDLILLDVRMPKMTGYAACEALKTSPETKDIPVVFISAKGQEAEIRQAMEVGAIGYILKPFSPDDLAALVKRLLAGSDQA
jgi:CheY-like chemotaxis protein